MARRHPETHQAASFLRALAGVFVVCVLIFSGLSFGTPIEGGRRGEPRPIKIQSLNNVLFYRIKSGNRHYYARHCVK